MDIFSAFGNWCGGPGFWHSGGGQGMSSWMPFHFGGIFPILMVGLLVYLAIRIFRNPAIATGQSSPQETLKQRYAAGEINKEAFDRMKDELKY